VNTYYINRDGEKPETLAGQAVWALETALEAEEGKNTYLPEDFPERTLEGVVACLDT